MQAVCATWQVIAVMAAVLQAAAAVPMCGAGASGCGWAAAALVILSYILSSCTDDKQGPSHVVLAMFGVQTYRGGRNEIARPA